MLRKKIALVLENKKDGTGIGRQLNWFLVVLISLNILAIILGSVDSIYQHYEYQLWLFELFSVCVFSIEYLARVWVAVDVASAHGESAFKTRLKYIFSPMALIDLIAILPFYLSLYMAIDLRFLRVLRLLRLFKLTRYSPAMEALLDVIQKESEALLAAIIVLLMMLVISSSGIYLLESQIQPEVFGSIPDSMWWAIMTLTTVGYGDVVPITTGGKIFGGIIGLTGVGMVALPAAILASGFAENLNQRRLKYNTYIKHALIDGHINDQERWQLEKIRKELGLGSEEAIHLLDDILRLDSGQMACPHCGEKIDRRMRENKIEK